MLSTARTADVVLIDVLLHLFLAPSIDRTLRSDAVLCHVILNQLISAETLLTSLTIHQRIRESTEMTGSYPGLGIHQNCTVNAYVVRALLNEFLPPSTLYVVLQLNAKIAVIPGICQSAVDLRSRIYKSTVLRQCYNLFHCFFHCPITSFFYTTISISFSIHRPNPSKTSRKSNPLESL